jgi:hypothetical protein
MAGGIGFADVRFGLDDDTAGADAPPFVDEDLADQIAGHIERGTIVEAAKKFCHG